MARARSSPPAPPLRGSGIMHRPDISDALPASVHSMAGAEHGRDGAQSGDVGEGIALHSEQVSVEAGSQPPFTATDLARLGGRRGPRAQCRDRWEAALDQCTWALSPTRPSRDVAPPT